MKTEAWSTMKPGPRALYLELKRRYNGHNNGELFLSQRDAAKALNITPNTVTKYFRELVERGFIFETEGPILGSYGCGRATRWALAEEMTSDGKTATKGFASWTAKTVSPRIK